MATHSALHPIHHLLAILAGDAAPGVNGDAATDSLASLAGRLGWTGLEPDPLEADDVREAETWFVRVTFPGIAPPDAFIISLATAAGLRVESLAQGPAFALGTSRDRETGAKPYARWLIVAPQSRSDISAAVARLRAVHRIHAVPFRTVEDR